jgi:hypothetical protein
MAVKMDFFSNVLPIDINCGPLVEALGEFNCMYVVRIYLWDPEKVSSKEGNVYYSEKFGRN